MLHVGRNIGQCDDQGRVKGVQRPRGGSDDRVDGLVVLLKRGALSRKPGCTHVYHEIAYVTGIYPFGRQPCLDRFGDLTAQGRF